MQSNEYQDTGTSCHSCEAPVRDTTTQTPCVTDIEVSAARGQLLVTANDVDDNVVMAAVGAAGYSTSQA